MKNTSNLDLNFIKSNTTNSSLIDPDINEVLRYLGIPKKQLLEFNTDKNNQNTRIYELQTQAKKAISEMQPLLLPKAVYANYIIEENSNNLLKFGSFQIQSKDLSVNLINCEYVTILAATIGPRVDLLIQKYAKLDICYAAILQATGAMFVEQYVENLNSLISNEYKSFDYITKPRYSPGYGDLTLSTQKQIFSILNPQTIGLTLMESLIMAPEKSVTAFIGAKKIFQP